MKKNFRKPHRFKKTKPIYRNRFFWLGILGGIILLAIIYFFFFSAVFYTKKVTIVGENKVSEEAINSLIGERLESKILFFKTKSIFLVDLKEITNEIINSSPHIASVDSKKKFPNALYFEIKERVPVAIFTQEQKLFFIDESGILFEEVFEAGDHYFKITDLALDREISLKETAVEREVLDQILVVAPKVTVELKIPINEFVVSSKEKIIVLTDEGWEIYFNFENDIDWQLTKLKAVLEEKIPSENRKNLDYIDLRFGNFAPYKYKD